jgi:hypothetical protein
VKSDKRSECTFDVFGIHIRTHACTHATHAPEFRAALHKFRVARRILHNVPRVDPGALKVLRPHEDRRALKDSHLENSRPSVPQVPHEGLVKVQVAVPDLPFMLVAALVRVRKHADLAVGGGGQWTCIGSERVAK